MFSEMQAKFNLETVYVKMSKVILLVCNTAVNLCASFLKSHWSEFFDLLRDAIHTHSVTLIGISGR